MTDAFLLYLASLPVLILIVALILGAAVLIAWLYQYEPFRRKDAR